MYTPSFWLMISFLLLFAAMGRRFYKALRKQLRDRNNMIARQMREISDLHEEAQTLYFRERARLKKARSKSIIALAQATDHGKSIVAQAKIRASKLATLQEASQKRREELMKNRLMDDLQKEVSSKICSLVEESVIKQLSEGEHQSYTEQKITEIKL